jgi:hypothetical protein
MASVLLIPATSDSLRPTRLTSRYATSAGSAAAGCAGAHDGVVQQDSWCLPTTARERSAGALWSPGCIARPSDDQPHHPRPATHRQCPVDAIREGDGDAAAAAVADHFRHVGEQAVHSLTKAGFWDDAGPAPASVDGSAPDG